MIYIKELRESTGLSQSEFANLFNIPVSTLRKWEQNDSTPPAYVIDLIKKALPFNDKQFSCYLGSNGDKYYLDEENKRVSDSLGNWISFHEDINGVIEDNIGIYIENLFQAYKEAVANFDKELKFDKINKIKWR